MIRHANFSTALIAMAALSGCVSPPTEQGDHSPPEPTARVIAPAPSPTPAEKFYTNGVLNFPAAHKLAQWPQTIGTASQASTGDCLVNLVVAATNKMAERGSSQAELLGSCTPEKPLDDWHLHPSEHYNPVQMGGITFDCELATPNAETARIFSKVAYDPSTLTTIDMRVALAYARQYCSIRGKGFD